MSLKFNIQTFDTLSSTQDHAKLLAGQGAGEGLVIQALTQERGRGRHGRVWESKPGNLYLSVLLRPKAQPKDVGALSLLAGVSVFETASHFLPDPSLLMLKWPNDLLLEGRKCAGLLLESSGPDMAWVVLGIGIDLLHAPPGEGACLAQYTDHEPDLDKVRDVFLTQLDKYYTLWRAEGMAPIKQAWLERGHALGAPARIRTSQEIIQGAFEGLDDFGNLTLKEADGNFRTVSAGDLYLG